MDTSLGQEFSDVRHPDSVTVRHQGHQVGKIYFYNQVRQMNRSHNLVGKVVTGSNLVHLVPLKGKVMVRPDPVRIMTIGMTQAQGEAFLTSLGKKQKRTGDASDEAIIVEQEPEMTIYAMKDDEIETMGVRSDKIFAITMNAEESPWTARYFRKVTGLDHKPIGTIKVHFTFEDMPMITFEGNPLLAADLYPEKQFEVRSSRGDMAITNMSRPQRGLMGIRLEESEEFGPTGEESQGANILGRFLGDLDALMKDVKEEDVIYVRQARPEEMVAPRKKVKRPEEKAEGEKPKAKKPVKKTAKKPQEGSHGH
jgi:putative methanogenesis marker protein 3